MKRSANRLTFILMVSSIVLLLALQGFWLTSSYEKAYHDLRRETGGLFRSTVLALRDSSLRRQLIHVKDSQTNITVSRRYNASEERLDTLTKGSGQIKIFITTDREIPDSINAIIDPLASGIRDGKLRRGQNFILRMNGDSLSIDSIQSHFSRALAGINIFVPLEIRQSAFLPPNPTHAIRIFRRSDFTRDRLADEHPFSNEMSSDWITIDPLHRYSAIITDIRSILIKNILPQILFSFFLTVVTAAAFIILSKSLRAQQRLLSMKNDFISNITHELKTPIATVSVAIEALKNFNQIDNPTRTREYLDIAQHELNRLSMLTDKVLNASLFDEKGVKLELEKVNLEKVIEEIINSMSLSNGKGQLTIEFKKTGSDFIVNGSLVHLTNVIYNLIDNAIKYSISKPEIVVELREAGNSLYISITDNGIGIPREFHDKIFEKFFRMPTGDIHTIKGYGLGLSYVEGIVRAHNGKISIISELEKGSTFTISLPKNS